MSEEKFTSGQKVYYTYPHGAKQNGIIKQVVGLFAFVVFNFAGERENYKNYTGQHTLLSDLSEGWVDESGKLLKEFCKHRYLPSSSKWQPANRVECQFCGDVID